MSENCNTAWDWNVGVAALRWFITNRALVQLPNGDYALILHKDDAFWDKDKATPFHLGHGDGPMLHVHTLESWAEHGAGKKEED